MANLEEPAYMLAARGNVRAGVVSSSATVEKLLKRIDSLEKENGRLNTELDKVWGRTAY